MRQKETARPLPGSCKFYFYLLRFLQHRKHIFEIQSNSNLKDEKEALKTQDRNLEEKFWETSKCAHLDTKSSRTTLDKELISPNNSKYDMCNKMFVSEINTM